MYNTRQYLTLLFCMALTACGYQPTQATVIQIQTIHSSAFCEGAGVAGIDIVRTKTFNNSINPEQNINTQPETTDTDKIKIQINMGRFNTAGYAITATRADSSDKVLTLYTDWQEPAANTVLAQVITQPCVIISLQKQTLERVQVFDQHGRLRFSQQLK